VESVTGVATNWDDSATSDTESSLRPNWQLRVLIAVCAGCALAYIGYALAFGVNAIFWDEWNWIDLLRPGQPTLQTLWAQHNDNIVFFPNLVAVLLIRLTNWNDFAFYGMSAALMVCTLCIVVKVFWSEVKQAPLWWVLVPFLVLTLAQYQNMLWAFQIAWAMAIFSLVASFALLSRSPCSYSRLILASLLGVLASYSLLQGLTVWPIGLVVLLTQGQPRKLALVWSSVGALAIVGYFADFSFASSSSKSLRYVLEHLANAASGLLIAVGSVVPNIDSGLSFIVSQRITKVLGATLLVCGAIVVITWIAQGRPSGAKAFCVALVLITVLFDLLLVPGRLVISPMAGATPRYVTFNWPLLLGVYAYALICLGGVPRHRFVALTTRVGLASIVLAQVVVASIVGVAQGQVTRTVRLTSADVLANWQTATPAVAAPYLYPPCADYAAVCIDLSHWASFVQQSRMNIFADPSSVAQLQSLGIVPGGMAARQLAVPEALKAAISADPSGQKAWNVLSSVYTSDPALMRAYPKTQAGTLALVQWAAATGSSVSSAEIITEEWAAPVTSDLFLQQYADTYRTWADALSQL
jgi:hypothetical protein